MPNAVIQRVQGVLQRMIGYSAGLPQGQIVDKTLQGVGAIPLRGEAPTDYQRTGTTVRIRGFERHPVVQACIRAIVDIASAIPLQQYRKQGNDADGREVIDVSKSSDPGQILVDTPSPFLSSKRLRALTIGHFLTYGNALWFLERPVLPNGKQPAIPKPPVNLRIIHPEDVFTVYANQKGYPVWYMWRDILGYTHTSPVTDIVHFRDLNMKGLVFGYPRAASALNDIIGDDEASQFVRQTVTNSGAPMQFALVNDDTTQEEAQLAEAKFHEKMVMRGERGKFVFMGGVKEIVSNAFTLKELEFPDLRRVAREDICAAFGVDPRMVGITSASKDAGLSGTQYIEARKRLIQQTVQPLMKDFESELNLWLAPEFGDVYYRFDPDALQALVEDDDATSTRIIAQVGAGLRSVEEGRKVLELPSEYRDGDLLAMPSMTVLTPTSVATATGDKSPEDIAKEQADKALADAKLSAGVGPDGKPLNPTAAAATAANPNAPKAATPKLKDDGKDKAKNRGSKPSVQTVVSPDPCLVLTRGIVLAPTQRVLLWQQFDQRALKEEAAYRRAAMMMFAEERSNVAKAFGRHADAFNTDESAAKAVRKQLRLAYKSGGEVVQRWTDRFHPIIGETVAKGAETIAGAIRTNRSEARATPHGEPFTYDFHLSAPDVQQAIRARASRLADNVGETTGAAVDDAIAIGIRESMGMAEIAKLVDSVAFGTGAGYRATMIARTESIGALNEGQFLAAEDSGVVAGKEWLTQGDDAVRDSHAECEGQGMIAMGEAFSNGLQHPGDEGPADEVINCRCTLLYYDTLEAGVSSV